MNIIKEIKKAIGDNVEPFKIAVFQDEVVVYVWEQEIPIDVFTNQKSDFNRVVLDVDGYDWKLNAHQIQVLGKIMQILVDNIDEVKAWNIPV